MYSESNLYENICKGDKHLRIKGACLVSTLAVALALTSGLLLMSTVSYTCS